MIFAGVVLYYPNLVRLKANIEKLFNQVKGIIFYDNGCDEAVKEYIKNIDKGLVFWTGTGVNEGMAKALNVIMKTAENEGVDWVITMDQDSILPANYVEAINRRAISDDIAIVCPKVIDKRRVFSINDLTSTKDEFVKKCITSASCTRVQAWNYVGGFDEFLFIDLVDNDFCKRLQIVGFRILKINEICLDQEFGEIELKSPWIVESIMKICTIIPSKKLAANFSKLSYKKKVYPMRIYYTNRNILYLNKKLKRYGGIGYESYNCNSYVGFIICFIIPSFLRAKEKRKVLKAIIRGIMDGISVRPNEWITPV